MDRRTDKEGARKTEAWRVRVSSVGKRERQREKVWVH